MVHIIKIIFGIFTLPVMIPMLIDSIKLLVLEYYGIITGKLIEPIY